EYQQGLAIAQTMPGPLAAQLAMWLGYLERGARGALWVALPFVVPPFLIVTAVAALYAHYQGLSQVESVFFGVGPAVMAIIALAAGDGQGLCLARRRRLAGNSRSVLRQGERAHVRLRARRRTLSPPGPGHRPPLVDRAPANRRGRDGPDQPRPGGDHGHLRWLPRRRCRRRGHRDRRPVHPHVPVRRRPGSAVSPLRAAPAATGIRQGRDSRCGRR